MLYHLLVTSQEIYPYKEERIVVEGRLGQFRHIARIEDGLSPPAYFCQRSQDRQ